jgi:hypothetical protein
MMIFSSNSIDWQTFLMDYISVQNGNNLLNMYVNTLRTGDTNLRLYAYKQFKYPVPNVLR